MAYLIICCIISFYLLAMLLTHSAIAAADAYYEWNFLFDGFFTLCFAFTMFKIFI